MKEPQGSLKGAEPQIPPVHICKAPDAGFEKACRGGGGGGGGCHLFAFGIGLTQKLSGFIRAL